MNRISILTCLVAAVAGAAAPSRAAFTPGNLVILTDPASAGDNAGSITLNEYAYNALTGTFGASPTAHAISGITLPGTNNHDGLLHASTNGSYLTFGGYQAAAGTTGVVTSNAPRALGTVDSNWGISTTQLTGYTGVAIRSVVSTDGKHFWTGGDQGMDGGQYFVDASGASASQTRVNANDARGNVIDHGQLWSVSSSVGGGSKIGTGLPTSAAASTLAMADNGGALVKSDVVFLDLNNDGTSDTAYTTDGKNLLGKWSYNSTTSIWSQTGSWTGNKTPINNINSLAAFVYNGTVELLTATQAGQLFQLPDTNGITSNFSAAFLANTSPTPVFTATDGSTFRGMAILIPEPTSMMLLGLGALLLVQRRNNTGAR